MVHQFELTGQEREALHDAFHRLSLDRVEATMPGNVLQFHKRAKHLADQTWAAAGEWEPKKLRMDNLDIWVFHNACFATPNPMYEASDWAREVYEPIKDSPYGQPETDPYGKGWSKARRKALENSGGRCQDCGLTAEQHRRKWDVGLHVHHIKPVRTFDDYSEAHYQANLTVLCQSCHSDRHSSR